MLMSFKFKGPYNALALTDDLGYLIFVTLET